jgi:hypothetical protein
MEPVPYNGVKRRGKGLEPVTRTKPTRGAHLRRRPTLNEEET